MSLLLFAILVQATYCVGDMMVVVRYRNVGSMPAAIATDIVARPCAGLRCILAKLLLDPDPCTMRR